MSRADGWPPADDDLGAEDGDHRAVVGAQGGPRGAQRDAPLGAPARPAARAAGGWRRPRRRSAGRSLPWSRAGVHRLGAQHVADRLLEARGDVGERHRLAVPLARLDPARDRGLQPGEGEVEAVPVRSLGAVSPRGKAIAARVAGRAARSICGPPGIRQAEQPGHLVVGLAGGVVDGRRRVR